MVLYTYKMGQTNNSEVTEKQLKTFIPLLKGEEEYFTR